MKKNIRFLAIILIMFATIGIFGNQIAYPTEKKQNILVIHSYHPGLAWTDSKNQGILNGAKEHYKDINVFVEYLDWKKYPYQDNLTMKYEIMKYKYKNIDIDVLITTDDAALEFAINHREELFNNAPIAFSGVSHNNAKKITSNQQDIVGVIEEADIENTVGLAKALYPGLENIYVIYDQTESGLSMGYQAMEYIKKFYPNINVIQSHEKHVDDIVKRINRLPEKSAALITIFYNDTDKTIMGFERNARYIAENSGNLPIFVLYDFMMGSGALGGSLISGELQGQLAFELAEDILLGTDVNTIPYVQANSIKKQVDHNSLQRLGINKSQIPSDFEIFNKPLTILDTHAPLIYSISVILIALLIFIVILVYYLRRLVHLKKSLQNKNREQMKLYDELASSEEELQAQLEELHTTYEELYTAQDKLSYMAYHDFLTGLNNRAGFVRRFDELLNNNKIQGVDIIILDIDNFKVVNDTMGHAFGDKLICEVAVKIRELIEPDAEIYRIGGDEFIILIPITNDRGITNTLIQHLKNEFDKPLTIENNPINVSFSMGLVSFPQHGKEPDDLLKKADIAMYKSKETSKGSLTVFNDDMLEKLTQRKKVSELLRGALNNKELYLHFQPQLDVKEDVIWGVEALLRWNNPYLGTVPPDIFINIAEENQMIIEIGTWVLEESCKFMKSCEAKDIKNRKISVNISPVQLVQEDFVELVFAILDKYDIKYSTLELEITESIMVESYDVIFAKLSALRNRGIRIALDDFGTGYSSLSYLKKLPIDTIKIDRSFIIGIEDDNKKQSVVSTIIEMGRIMNLEVVVEGVETKEQQDFVVNKGCHRIQGYFFARPQPEEQVLSIM